MIKFKYAIHKPTQTLFTYEDWLKNKDDTRNWHIKSEDFDIKFKMNDILFSDDFEIIYDNEFTEEEYERLYSNIAELFGCNELSNKIEDKLNSINDLKYKFGVDE